MLSMEVLKIKIFIFSLMALDYVENSDILDIVLELLSADFHIFALKPGTPRT